jgi:hypothetical protein
MPSRYKPPSTRNIRRIDSPKSHGYQVHVERNGQVYTKHFSDSHYPSPAKARKAAMEYRDRLLAELPPSQPQQGFRMRAHSNTGEVGISLTHMTRKTGDPKPYITVSVSPEPGKMLGRKFSIERYGYEGAIQEAKLWRDSVLQERNRKLERRRQKEHRRLLSDDSANGESGALDDAQAEVRGAATEEGGAASLSQSAAAPARRRGRPRKTAEAAEQPAAPVDATPRRRGRPPRRTPSEELAPASNTAPVVSAGLIEASSSAAATPTKRGRGRPPKHAKA